MRITRLKLQNFKNFDDVELHFGDVNIFVGANASGKSNLFEAIRFLKNINLFGLENAISLSGGIELLGSVQKQGQNLPTRLEIDYDIFLEHLGTLNNASPYFLREYSRITYQLEITGSTQRTFSANESFSADTRVYGGPESRKRAQGGRIDFGKTAEYELVKQPSLLSFEAIRNTGGDVSHAGSGRNELDVFHGNSKVSVPINLIESRWQQLSQIFQQEDLVSDPLAPEGYDDPYLGNPFASLLAKTSDLHRFDGKSIRLYDFDLKRAKGWISPATKAELEENGENLAKIIQKIQSDSQKAERFQLLAQSVLPYVKGFDVQKLNGSALSVSLTESYAPAIALPGSALSDGTIGVAAIIAALFFEKNAIAMFEEPERGVHPSLLGGLMGLFYEASDKQVFITTHSPEVLNYAKIEDIFLVSRDEKGSSTVIKPAEKEMVRALLAEHVSIGNLFTQQLLDH